MSDHSVTFHQSLTGARGCVMEVDHGWRITKLDEAAEETLGIGREVIGVSLWEVFPASATTYARRILEDAIAGTEEVQFRFYGRELCSLFNVRLKPTSAGLTIILYDLAKAWSPDSVATAHFDYLLEKFVDQLRQMIERPGVTQRIERKDAPPSTSEPWSDQRLATIAEAVYRHRLERAKVFNQQLTQAQWNVMLDLYIQTVCNNRVSVTSACIAADAPQTTGLRVLEELHAAGLITRVADIRDRRRTWVELTQKGLIGMRRYLCDTAELAAKVPH